MIIFGKKIKPYKKSNITHRRVIKTAKRHEFNVRAKSRIHACLVRYCACSVGWSWFMSGKNLTTIRKHCRYALDSNFVVSIVMCVVMLETMFSSSVCEWRISLDHALTASSKHQVLHLRVSISYKCIMGWISQVI